MTSATGYRGPMVRQQNLAAVLRLVHRAGAASRAEITAQTGLNRSTVAALVGELVELGLVTESSPEATRRVGRPSPIVAPHHGPVAIAINPEVDAVTIAVVGLGARVVARVRREVDHAPTPDETVALIVATLDDLADELRGHRVVGVGLAVPGLVRTGDGLVRWAPHLDWTDIPLVERVEKATGYPTRAANDASLGAMAEHLFGAGRGIDELIYLNGGASGIGGGVITGGAALGGSRGYAGEFGQNRPGFQDLADRRTPNGTLEDEVSRARLLDALGLHGGDEATLEAALLESTDAVVHEELARQRRVLAVALSNAINVLNPQRVVLGGFLAAVLASDPGALAADVTALAVPAAGEGSELRPAQLAEDRLMIGAAELAFENLLAHPAQLEAGE